MFTIHQAHRIVITKVNILKKKKTLIFEVLIDISQACDTGLNQKEKIQNLIRIGVPPASILLLVLLFCKPEMRLE